MSSQRADLTVLGLYVMNQESKHSNIIIMIITVVKLETTDYAICGHVFETTIKPRASLNNPNNNNKSDDCANLESRYYHYPLHWFSSTPLFLSL